MPTWKKILFRSMGFGIGVATTVIMAVSAYSWYSSRPKPWDSKSITTTFDRVITEGSANTYMFSFTMQNNSKEDYTLTKDSNVIISAKLLREKSISTSDENDSMITIDSPVFVPAGQRSHINIHLKYPSKIKVPVDDGEAAFNKYKEDVKMEISKTVPNINGFMIFDKSNKYQIDFSKGW